MPQSHGATIYLVPINWQSMTSNRIVHARPVGTFFLLAFLAYGFGRYYFDSGDLSVRYVGALLIILNSVVVLLIGVLMNKTLRQYSAMVGNIYLAARIFEATALSSIVSNLWPGVQISEDLGYFLAMLVLGLGSIPMCLTLYRHRLAPSWLALWGALGYALFAFGFLLELFGKPWSMYLLVVAALWEITFAIWLVVKSPARSANPTIRS